MDYQWRTAILSGLTRVDHLCHRWNDVQLLQNIPRSQKLIAFQDGFYVSSFVNTRARRSKVRLYLVEKCSQRLDLDAVPIQSIRSIVVFLTSYLGENVDNTFRFEEIAWIYCGTPLIEPQILLIFLALSAR